MRATDSRFCRVRLAIRWAFGWSDAATPAEAAMEERVRALEQDCLRLAKASEQAAIEAADRLRSAQTASRVLESEVEILRAEVALLGAVHAADVKRWEALAATRARTIADATGRPSSREQL